MGIPRHSPGECQPHVRAFDHAATSKCLPMLAEKEDEPWFADEGGKYVPKLELMDVVRCCSVRGKIDR